MKAKMTMVTLEVDNATQDFEISHAERLLKITKAGWHLPKSSKYEFVNNAIRVKQDKKGNAQADKCAIPVDGEDTSAKD